MPISSVRSSNAVSSAAQRQLYSYEALEDAIAELEAQCSSAHLRKDDRGGEDSIRTVSAATDSDQILSEQDYLRLVEDEFNRYIADGVLTNIDHEDIDLCQWWQVRCFIRLVSLPILTLLA